MNENINKIISESEAHFNIKIVIPCTKISHNYIAEAQTADGTSIIIKIFENAADSNNEINFLKIHNGNSMVKLLNSDSKAGVLLLEKLMPGKNLVSIINDDEATIIAAHLIKKLFQKIPENYKFPSTKEWFTRLDKAINLPITFSESLVDKARQIALNLHQDVKNPVLLHGDLHHFNILSSERSPWLAIDPKGVIGCAEYEVGTLLRNPIPNIATEMNTKKILARRAEIFAEILGFDRQKIIAWGFVQAVLSAVWSLDDLTQDWQLFLKCAESLQ